MSKSYSLKVVEAALLPDIVTAHVRLKRTCMHVFNKLISEVTASPSFVKGSGKIMWFPELLIAITDSLARL